MINFTNYSPCISRMRQRLIEQPSAVTSLLKRSPARLRPPEYELEPLGVSRRFLEQMERSVPARGVGSQKRISSADPI
jgi:hypothetical protein